MWGLCFVYLWFVGLWVYGFVCVCVCVCVCLRVCGVFVCLCARLFCVFGFLCEIVSDCVCGFASLSVLVSEPLSFICALWGPFL